MAIFRDTPHTAIFPMRALRLKEGQLLEHDLVPGRKISIQQYEEGQTDPYSYRIGVILETTEHLLILDKAFTVIGDPRERGKLLIQREENMQFYAAD